MESAPMIPPAPTPDTPSRKLYMTPHIAKRKDGICPSLLHILNASKRQKDKPGQVSKQYQTKSSLLLQVKEREGFPREVLELQALIEAVNRVTKSAVTEQSNPYVTNLKFKAEGCIWKLSFHPSLGNEAEKHHRIEIVCCANLEEETKETNYVLDAMLISKLPAGDGNEQLPGFAEAKEAYDKVAYAVRKAVVRLEFPDFPQGMKKNSPLFKDCYQLNARLKSGSFATVCRGTHRATSRKVAVKCVLRKDLPPQDDCAIYEEVAIMASIKHPHIVPVLDFFEEPDCYFIAMELMSGGDLFDRIGKKKSYCEADARDLVNKLLLSIATCHQKNIAHCDLKPKNLLLATEDDDSFIKLADFGFAARVHQPKSLTKQCGTPFFVAPEILIRRPYDQQSDMWSVGCIVYLLLSGSLPFLGRSQKELFRKIIAGRYDFKEEIWCDISVDAKDLVQKLLVLDPDIRLSAKKALLHPWLKAPTARLSKNNLLNTSQRLKVFNAKMKLRSAMITVDTVTLLKRVSKIAKKKNERTLKKSKSVRRSTSGKLLTAGQCNDDRVVAV